MAKQSYTLLEYLVALENKVKDLKIIVDNNIGTDYSEILSQINNLANQINIIKTEFEEARGEEINLNTRFNKIVTQLNNNVNEINEKINELATSGSTTEAIQNKISEMVQNGSITFNTVTPEMTTFIEVENSINLFNINEAITGYIYKPDSNNGNIMILSENNKYMCFKVKINAQENYTVTRNGYSIYYTKLDSNVAESYSSSSTSTTFKLGGNRSGEYYAYISFRIDTIPPDNYMMVKGDTLPDTYIPYYTNNKLSDDIIISYKSIVDNPIKVEEIYTVGKNKDYTNLTECLKSLKDNHNNKTIYIDGGNYNVFEEIGGRNFALSINDTITSWKDVSIIVPNNTKIIGLGEVVLDFSPSVNDISSVGSQYLSCLNVIYNNFHLENVTITCNNCRYGIHDETGGNYGDGFHSYKNVKIIKKSTSKGMAQAFGCGFSPKQTLEFDCCYFYAPTLPFSCHNNGSTEIDNTLIKATNTIFSSNSSTNNSIRFGNVNGKQVKVNVNLSNCYIKNGIQVKNEISTERPNAFEVTLLNCNDVPVEILNKTNIYNPLIFR